LLFVICYLLLVFVIGIWYRQLLSLIVHCYCYW